MLHVFFKTSETFEIEIKKGQKIARMINKDEKWRRKVERNNKGERGIECDRLRRKEEVSQGKSGIGVRE